MTSEEEEMRKYTYVMTGMKTWELLVIIIVINFSLFCEET